MRVIAIGTQSDIKHNRFTGQSVMFDGVVDKLKSQNHQVTIVDINSRFKSNSTVLRSIDYMLVLTKMVCCLLVNNYQLGYITTSQSKNGFLRDYAIINLLRLFRVKVIAHQYGANYRQLLDSLDEGGLKRLKKLLDYVSVIIVEGQHMKNQFDFLEGHQEKVVVIPNGLPIVGKKAMQPKNYTPKTRFRMFYLSNLIWTKGYFDVLQAVDLLVNKYHKNVECIFSGAFMASADDPKPGISNKADFDHFVEEHKLENVVSYYPGMYGDEKDKAFFDSNVFLLPTYYINEGQPVSIIEAMAYGCVPIVTEYRHIPMMINRDNGFFVKPQNPTEIAEAIVWLMEHPEEYARKSERCISDYMEKFTFDKYASKVQQCMEEVVRKK